MKKLYILVLLFTTILSFSQSAGDIIITEIMQDPDVVTDGNGEYFELYNTTGSDIDIEGWSLKDDGTNTHVIANGSPLLVPAGGYLVLGKSTNMTTNGGVPVAYDFGSYALGNSDDEVVILTPGMVEIDRVNFDGGTNFPDPTGASMNLDPTKYSSAANDNGANWCVSTIDFGGAGDLGSPGAVNETCPTLGIDDNQQTSFSIYPNPTSIGFVNIRSNSGEAMSIQIFDVLGKRVMSQTLSNERLDVSALKTGIYIMKITQASNTATKKLVIK